MPVLPILRLGVFTLFLTSSALAAGDPVYKTLRDAPLGDSFVVEGIQLHRDGGVILLKNGVLAFTAPTLGRDTVAVFTGDAEFRFTPESNLDKNYMRSLTGQETVTESFDRALFCFTDDTGKEIRSAAKTPQTNPKLAEILRDYRKKLRSRTDSPRSMVEAMLTDENMDNIEAELLTDLYNPKAPGFFSAYLHGKKYSDLRFHFKPRGAFASISSPEEVALINVDPDAPQEGIWYLSHRQSELKNHTASSDENNRIVQADQYKIETLIARNDHFTATTDLQFHAVTDGDRVIQLSLLPTLRVSRVSIGNQEIPFIQEERHDDPTLYVVMPEPMAKGSSHEFVIEYLGDKVVHKEGNGNFAVEARESWYPNVNTFRDHASYDLTFKVPKAFTLVSIGSLAKQWTDKDFACTQWISDAPVAVAGFNYGSFKTKKVDDAQLNMAIEGYANVEPPDMLASMRSDATGTLSPAAMMGGPMSEAQNALRIFTAYFGKSPYKRVAVTQQTQFNFGQSWPNLVYLPLFAYMDPTQRYAVLGRISSSLTNFVDEVTSHEVSHQWWGHMVGWSSYHEQWRSEGFATFSAGLYLQLTEKTQDKYLKYWQTWRERLLQKNNFGRRANDAGPLNLGVRLMSAKNDDAYQAVTYGKGAYVLHMLRQMMYDPKEGDKLFKETMQDYVSTYLNQNASSESFQKVVEKHMRPAMNMSGDGKLDWFFNEWVYGTAVPRYKFDYTLTDLDGGKVQLKGTLVQSEVGENFAMPVPLYAEFDGQIARLGLIPMRGNATYDLNLTLPKKPKRVMINYSHDVLEAM